jgi:outer membrane lipopolysaccharide assembly protein LptE/RlpB
MRAQRGWVWLGLIGLALVAASCGYRFVGGEPLPGDVRRIFVPMAENRTAESGMEAVVTNALRREIIRRGLTVCAHRAGADAALTAAIVRASGDTITRETTVTALERQASLTVVVSFTGAEGTRRRTVTTWETYAVTGDRSAMDHQRRLALEEAADRLAQKVLTDLSADF